MDPSSSAPQLLRPAHLELADAGSPPSPTGRAGWRTSVLAGCLLGAALVSGCRTDWNAEPEEPIRQTDSLRSFSPQLDVATAQRPRRAPYDVQHYGIDLTLDPARRAIDASCTIRLTARDEDLVRLAFDFAGLEVEAVEDEDGRSLGFSHQGEVLTIDLAQVLGVGKTTSLVVRYSGSPQKGLWFAGEKNGQPTHVFTQGECEDSRFWFPCFDHPSDFATTEVTVTMPETWTSIAAGERVSRRASGRSVTESWRMDRAHAVYLTTLVAGELVVREDEWLPPGTAAGEGVPLYYVAEPHYVKWFDASFDETKDILTFLSEWTGIDYPYAKYSQACVENFPFGGMENISATTLTTLTLDDEVGTRDSQSHGLVAHEAAHQWFGDLVTCEDWPDIWLNEGFASYMTQLYFEHSRGIDDFRVRVRDAQVAYMNEDDANPRPIIHSVYADPIDLFTSHVYPGGATRLHLLRWILGDEAFQRGVRQYLTVNSGRPVTTAKLRQALEQTSGEDLGWFFDQWLQRPGYPEVETSWSWSASRKRLALDVVQRQDGVDGTPAAFRFPVEIEIRDRAGTKTHRVWVTERRESFEFVVEFDPVWVRFDKHGWIPMRHDARKRPEEWIAIAKGDDDVNGRRDAVRALGRLAEETNNLDLREVYRAEIVDRLRKERVPAVRVVAAEAAGKAGGLEARVQLVEAARNDESADVRVAAIEALRPWIGDPELTELALELYASGYSWETMGAAAGLYATAAPEDAYLWLTERLLLDDSPHDQLRTLLIERLGDLPNEAVLPQLQEWARDDSAHPTARAAAVKELAERARGRASVASFLFDMLDTEHYRLRKAVVEALGNFGDPDSRARLYDYYTKSVFSSERRAIEASFGPSY